MSGVASGCLGHFSWRGRWMAGGAAATRPPGLPPRQPFSRGPCAHDRSRPTLSPQALCRPPGPGPRRGRSPRRRGAGARGTRLPAHRSPRRGQDDRRADPRHGAQLPQPGPLAASPAASARTASGSGPARPTSTWSRSTRPATAGVDDARDLRERAMYAASQAGHHKVYIVDEAHMLTREAWNALLKILEEPPPRRGIRLRHHRAAEDRGHGGAGALPAAAVRLPPHRSRRHPRPPPGGAGRRGHRGGRGRAHPHRAPRRRWDARRALRARPVPELRRGRGHRRPGA